MIIDSARWEQWVTGKPPEPTKPLAKADYLKLDNQQRAYHDRTRREYNSRPITVRTQAAARIEEDVRMCIDLNRNAPPVARRGVAIDGVPTVGKSGSPGMSVGGPGC